MATAEPVGRNDEDPRAPSDITESMFVDEPGAGIARWVALGLALALVVWMGSPLFLPAPPAAPAPPPEVKPVTVSVRESAAERIPRLFIADGVAQPDRRTTLRTEMSGVIEAVEARKGDIVEAGALLARFRSARLEAEYARAREALAQATRDLKNAQSLGDRGAVPANQVVQAQTALAGARSTEAEARLALANAEIRAPFAGVLDDFDLEAGEYVPLGAEVGLLLDTDPLTVAFEVPLQAFASLALGQEAQIAFLTGQRATGALTFVGAHASAASRTFPAEVSVPNPDGVIPSGVSARVTLTTSEAMAHLIAASTLTLGADGGLGASFLAYGQHNNGTGLFPHTEPTFVIVDVVSNDSLSYGQREDLMRLAEARLLGLAGVETLYTEIHEAGSDLVGRFRLFLAPWQTREPARTIGEAARTATTDIAGLKIRVDAAGAGPAGGTPVQLEVIGRDLDAVNAAVDRIRGVMARIGDLVDVQDSRSSAGIEWVLDVDRREAARHGINLRTLERQLQLLTRGVDIGSFRPPDASEPIDIRVRMVSEERNFEHLRLLRVGAPDGLVPLANFATWAPEPRSGTITRVDQRRVMSISADVAPGVLVSDRVTALRGALAEIDLPQGVSWTFRGEAQRQDDAIGDLLALFAVGLVAMFTVLVLQFNSYRQALIVMSAIVISISGVLLGHLVTDRPFLIVMSGVGTIALAGIVVNNNIVLIERFNALRAQGLGAREAALRTGVQRARPVLLTPLTPALGLMSMLLSLEADVLGRAIVHGAPFTQYWVELSVAIVGGLIIATALTLVVTPAMLVLTRARAPRPAHPPVKDQTRPRVGHAGP